jgi:hypothetical protein
MAPARAMVKQFAGLRGPRPRALQRGDVSPRPLFDFLFASSRYSCTRPVDRPLTTM